MKVIITLTDMPDGKCHTDILFDPPWDESQPHTQATEAAMIALEALQDQTIEPMVRDYLITEDIVTDVPCPTCGSTTHPPGVCPQDGKN
jgi:hypothetical protein